MTRDDVFEIVRNHLAEELEVDPSAIADGTRFREDLGADSMDLMILGQELKDSHGVDLPEEEAVKIITVADAVTLVLAHLPASA